MTPCRERRIRNGYRVGIHDTAAEFRLKIEGRLAAPAAREAESCWRTASTTVSGRRFALDLTEVTAVDESAKDSLAHLREAGAEFLIDAARWGEALSEVAGTVALQSIPDRTPGWIARGVRAFFECLLWRLRSYCCPG